MRLFHISDLHFGLEDRAALAWFRECVRREQPDAVLITGDLTMRARSREFAAACEWIMALDLPAAAEPDIVRRALATRDRVAHCGQAESVQG